MVPAWELKLSVLGRGRSFECKVRRDFVLSPLLPVIIGEESRRSRLAVAPILVEVVELVSGLLPSRISFSMRCSSAAWAYVELYRRAVMALYSFTMSPRVGNLEFSFLFFFFSSFCSFIDVVDFVRDQSGVLAPSRSFILVPGRGGSSMSWSFVGLSCGSVVCTSDKKDCVRSGDRGGDSLNRSSFSSIREGARGGKTENFLEVFAGGLLDFGGTGGPDSS